MIDLLYNARKDIFVFFLFVSLGFLGMLAWANHTQVAIYSQDIPPNLVCIKDTYPDAYLCIVNDQEIPWYLSSKGELANAR